MQVVVVKENLILLSEANHPLRAETFVLSAGDSPLTPPPPPLLTKDKAHPSY